MTNSNTPSPPTLQLGDTALALDGRTAVLGIIGDPVAQVKACLPLTTLLQRQGLNAVLVPLHTGAAQVPALLAALRDVGNFAGLVVTVPHKQLAAGLLLDRTRAAQEAQAVNVIRKVRGKSGIGWQGDLLDGVGFLAGLRRNGFEVRGRTVAIAGAGGAGNAITFALGAAGAAHMAIHDTDAAKRDGIVARLRAAGYQADAWDGMRPADLLVNATPVGMKTGDPLPIATGAIQPGMTVADVIMEPPMTRLLRLAEARGAIIVPGRHMMDEQLALMADFFGEAIRMVQDA